MKNSLDLEYKNACALKLCDYLLFIPSNKIRDEYQYHKFRILSDEFLTSFKRLISDEELFMTYSSSACYNAIVLAQEIDFSLGCEDFTKLIYSKGYNRYRFTSDVFYYEYAIKQLSLSSELVNNASVMTSDNLAKSLEYDYYFISSIGLEQADFLTSVFSEMLLNKNAIYSINKLIIENKELLKYNNIKKKIRMILNTNLKILENIDKEVTDLYYSNNLKQLDTNEIEVFKELNKNALNMINNIRIEPFNIDSIKQYYDYLKIEEYFIKGYKGRNADISTIWLDNIYYYIDNIDSITLENKKKLILLLNSKKDLLKDFELKKFNNYLNKVNLKEVKIDDDIYEFETRSNLFTYINAKAKLLQGDDSLYKKVISAREKDLYVFELLIQDDECYNKNIMYFNMIPFEYSIKKFLKEYPNMFLNEKILNRALALLNKSDSLDKKILMKRLSKIKKA